MLRNNYSPTFLHLKLYGTWFYIEHSLGQNSAERDNIRHVLATSRRTRLVSVCLCICYAGQVFVSSVRPSMCVLWIGAGALAKRCISVHLSPTRARVRRARTQHTQNQQSACHRTQIARVQRFSPAAQHKTDGGVRPKLNSPPTAVQWCTNHHHQTKQQQQQQPCVRVSRECDLRSIFYESFGEDKRPCCPYTCPTNTDRRK